MFFMFLRHSLGRIPQFQILVRPFFRLESCCTLDSWDMPPTRVRHLRPGVPLRHLPQHARVTCVPFFCDAVLLLSGADRRRSIG